MWLHMPIIQKVVSNAQKMYPSVSYAGASVPTYPSGQIGFVLCGTAEGVKFDKPRDGEVEGCRYYSKGIHGAAFVLPRFCEEALALKK
jgi:spermidine synthase